MIKILNLKNILTIVFLSVNAFVFSQNSTAKNYKEYIELRISYGFKKNKITTDISINTGESFPNSLRGIIENGETNDFVRVLKYNGLVLIMRNEVDVINYLSSIGWELKYVNKITVLTKEYSQYIFAVKE